MKNWRFVLLTALVCGCVTTLPRPVATGPTFGDVRTGKRVLVPITWEAANNVTIATNSLRIATPGTVVRSAPLPLQSLRLYDIAVTMRRGPGTRNRCALVVTDDQGREQRWGPVWQFPDQSRPDWMPLSPGPQRYIQAFVAPANTQSVQLELAVDQPAAPQLLPYTLWEWSELEIVARQPVVCGNRLGPNRLAGGDMELVSATGLPASWQQWGQPTSNAVQVVEGSDAKEGRHVLRVKAGTSTMFAATDVPVEQGTAWRISLWARGKGHLQVLAHCLSNDQPQPLRVGDPQSQHHTVDSPTWTQVEQTWFAAAPGIRSAQVVLGIGTATDLEIDGVEFQPYEK